MPWSRCRWCGPRRWTCCVPAEAEFVLEGTVYRDRRHAEGPFVDLTETYDVVRQEPVFVVKAITHRQDAIWQALLPGGAGAQAADGHAARTDHLQEGQRGGALPGCATSTPAAVPGCMPSCRSTSRHEDDGQKAIQAAFAGHRSCKHVFVVDEDIDIYDPAGGGMGHGDALPGRPRHGGAGQRAWLQPGPQRRAGHPPDHQDRF